VLLLLLVSWLHVNIHGGAQACCHCRSCKPSNLTWHCCSYLLLLA
jgi:hypothetical protein